MVARKKTTAKTAARSPRGRQRDALELLEKDHRTVDALFKRYERLGEKEGEKREVLDQICRELTVHAAIEEEIFYPEARDAIGERDEELLDEATVEHASLKALVSQLENGGGGDDLVDARVKVLSEYVKHHVKEEEDELFPKLRKAKSLDLEALGQRLLERKTELAGEAPEHALRSGNGNGRGARRRG